MEGEVPQRKMFIGGNWKCNGTVQSVKDLVNDVLNKATFSDDKLDVIVAPIALHVASVKALLNSQIKVACQNVSATGKGAFTGEISGEQLKDFDVNWVFIGHSERRNIYFETDAQIAAKVQQTQDIGVNSIVCIGETPAQREAGETNDVLKMQLDAFKNSIKDWNRIVIAYEPLWAIGTGKTATPEIAQAAHSFIRSWMSESVSEEVSAKTRLIYGGSVNGKNAADLFKQADIDGFLVGGASLKPDFLEIIAAANAMGEE